MGLRRTRHLRLSRQLVRTRAITRRSRSSLALPEASLRGRDEAAGGGINQMCMSSSGTLHFLFVSQDRRMGLRKSNKKTLWRFGVLSGFLNILLEASIAWRA